MSLTIKLPFVFIFFAKNRPCRENFKCAQQITCTKSFSVKLRGRSSPMPRFLARQLYLLFLKYFLLCFLFYLVCKMFSRMCFLTRKSGEKECILHSDYRKRVLIEKGNRFCKNQLPDVNLYLLFSLVYFQSLWKALLPI